MATLIIAALVLVPVLLLVLDLTVVQHEPSNRSHRLER